MSAYLPPVRCSWCAAVRKMRGPDAPNGWPSAIAPPCPVAILLSDLPVREARSDRRIVDLEASVERLLVLADHERRAAHALDAASDEQLAHRHRVRCGDHRRETARAVALDNLSGQRFRQTRRQQSMAGDATRIFATLVAATDDDIVDVLGAKRCFVNARLDNAAHQIIRANSGQCAAVAAERRTSPHVKICIQHAGCLLISDRWEPVSSELNMQDPPRTPIRVSGACRNCLKIRFPTSAL